MVNERSPAKAPLRSTITNEQLPRNAGGNILKPTNTPEFGKLSLPQTSIRAPAKESSVFIQPKSRPEHHRDREKSEHLHSQATKDATIKIIDPLVPRVPSTYSEFFAPIPQKMSHEKTHAAPTQLFGSMGSVYGGVQTANKFVSSAAIDPQNFIDLTTPTEPYTFVDPAKSQEELKALLEGVIEDEENLPRTRSRKQKGADVDDLYKKLKNIDIREEELVVASKVPEEEEQDDDDDGTVEGIKVQLLPHQLEGLEWMRGRELGTGRKGARVPKGGILADDMGLGKTLQSISLILTNPKPLDADTIAKRKLPLGLEKTTLVVAPLALIRQWEFEMRDKISSSHTLKVCVHHGPQRTKRFADLAKYDVVITTYQILVSEFGNSSVEPGKLKTGCFGLQWYRVILDEAHTIKNRNAKTTQACYALRSEYRWCLTGTPMQNNLDELQSLIKFLRIKPYDDLREWKDQIDGPMKKGRGDLAIKRLRHYLVIFMKRRTKDILKRDGALNPGGKPSTPGKRNSTGFKITERRIEKVFVQFSPQERHFYDRLEKRTDASIEEMMSRKVNYASALVMLLRLRQACNHPKLVAGKLSQEKDALPTEPASFKMNASDGDIDEVADMLGAMSVVSKKCEVCQLELGKISISEGAIRCFDCEKDLEDAENNEMFGNEKKHKKKHQKHLKENGQKFVPRKARNRHIVEDSDEDEIVEEGSWIVPKDERDTLTLGKAGGIDDENAEGSGEWLISHDEENFPGLEDIQTHKTVKKDATSLDSSDEVEQSDSDSCLGSDSAQDSDIKDEEAYSDEEVKSAQISASTKITHLMRILAKELDEHKFIVFSQFTSMLDLIEPFMRQKGFKFTRYDGSMKNDIREANLDRLRNDKNCRVLLCSLKCGSLGLNLTAATRVVILEPFWNPVSTLNNNNSILPISESRKAYNRLQFVEEQAIDRVHRLTQKIDVIVYKITIANSVEERILDLQERKRQLAKQTIEGGKNAGAAKLGMNEILQLFKRDVDHTLAAPGLLSHGLGPNPRILLEPGDDTGAGRSRVSYTTRKAERPSQDIQKEDATYGRRW